MAQSKFLSTQKLLSSSAIEHEKRSTVKKQQY